MEFLTKVKRYKCKVDSEIFKKGVLFIEEFDNPGMLYSLNNLRLRNPPDAKEFRQPTGLAINFFDDREGSDFEMYFEYMDTIDVKDDEYFQKKRGYYEERLSNIVKDIGNLKIEEALINGFLGKP